MNELSAEQILAEPRVVEAISRRRRLVWPLVVVVAFMVVSFCMATYLWPEHMMATVIEDSALPLGYLLCQLILVVSPLICAIYTAIMNNSGPASPASTD